MNDMPDVTKQNIIDRIGSALLEATFSDEMVFIPHSGNTDFGIDYSVELIDSKNKKTTGYLLSVQLKSHEKIVFDKNGNYSQSVKVSTINYWLNINMPVILVLADTTNHKFYGIDAKRKIRETFDLEKMNKQQNISLSINQSDLFSFKTCIKGYVEFEKYYVLYNSAIDSLNIYNFLKYISETSHRDWHMLVDDYEDLTREILSFADKYAFPFCMEQNLTALHEKMIKALGENYNDGYLDYDNYKELDRTNFNECTIKYLFELTKKICEEINTDKTLVLKSRLFKFKRLEQIMKDYGTPIWSEKWANSSLNALNCDYDFDEE